MKLDLGLLIDMHPVLTPTRAADLAHYAAVGLERHGHVSGAQLAARLDEAEHDASIGWIAAAADAGVALDQHRVTEEAAEAIALALVRVAFGWVVRRRLQRGESADWLLTDPDRGRVGLEVSGI